MAVYIVTGKLGNGKTLCSVGRIRDKLRAGCLVASNIDVDLHAMFGATARNLRVIRVPDKPVLSDLEAIGNGNASYDETQNGLLVLDECGTWFNSRNWQDKTRKDVNDWFLHARKLGWDILLIVQDISLIDSQAREAISEHTVFCRRIDNIAIPIVGTLFKALTGSRLRLPRVHSARVVYGTTEADLLSDRWIYRGTDLFRCYDTKQLFLSSYPHGVYSMLTPWHEKGRFQLPRNKEFYMRMTKIMWKRYKSPVALATGVLLGISVAATAAFASTYRDLKRQKAAAAAAPVVIVNTEPSAQDQFFERLKKFRIAGSWSINDNLYYRFRDDSNDKAPVYFSSDELAQAGIAVFSKNPCRAELLYEHKRALVFCL